MKTFNYITLFVGIMAISSAATTIVMGKQWTEATYINAVFGPVNVGLFFLNRWLFSVPKFEKDW